MIRLALLLAAALVATPAAAEWVGAGEVPLDGSERAWMVRATVNGSVNGLFLLDTGASFCVLSPGTAHRLSLPPTGGEMQLQTANGIVKAPMVRLRTVEIGGSKARDVQAVVHPALGPPLDGIIGLSYLNNFSYAVDAKQRVLRLRPGG